MTKQKTTPRYTADQYGSVYERRSDCNMHIGRLNGRTLAQWIKARESRAE